MDSNLVRLRRVREAAENLGRTNDDDDEAGAAIVEGFLESQEHREAMLDKQFVRTGVGVARGTDGLTYLAVIYVRR